MPKLSQEKCVFSKQALTRSDGDLTTAPEIKCSGGVPCNYCTKVEKSCVYERPRKDKLATLVP
jgi:hypothetical protein